MNTSKRLLTDNVSYFDLSKDFPKTSIEKNDGRIILTGKFFSADTPNQNGRLYPKKILEREIEKLLPLVRDNQIIAELDHPTDRAILEFGNACAKIVDLWWDGNDVMGKMQVLKGHPSGDKLLALIENGVKIGVSSRSIGSTEHSSNYSEYSKFGDLEIVCEDLNVITVDVVSNPSNFGSFVIKESMMLEWNTKRDYININSYTVNLDNFIKKYNI